MHISQYPHQQAKAGCSRTTTAHTTQLYSQQSVKRKAKSHNTVNQSVNIYWQLSEKIIQANPVEYKQKPNERTRLHKTGEALESSVTHLMLYIKGYGVVYMDFVLVGICVYFGLGT